MINGKLITLLKSFSAKDRGRFRKFLDSPVFNENQEMISLFNGLEGGLIDASLFDELTKEKIWKYLFGEAVYNDDRLRRLFSELNKLGMQFIAFEKYQNSDYSDALFLLPGINQTVLQKHFVGAVRQAKDQLRKSGYQNADFHYANYQIEIQSHNYLIQKLMKDGGPQHLAKADFHLDCYYIIKKLWHYTGLLIWKDVWSITLDEHLHLFPDFLNYVAQSKFIKVPTVAVYYSIVHIFLHPKEKKYFFEFRKLLDQNSKYFTEKELQSFYLTAQNYCAFQINRGNIEYYRELFNIYKTLIEKELILSNNIIEPGNYKNIITVGLMVDEAQWVESFIQEYSQFLPKENQDNDLNYNLAKVYFHQKKYDKVISQLREVEYKNLVYALGGKLMLLKTYYELKEVHALDSLIDSFRIYLHRNQLISRDVRQQYMNVLRFVRKLPLQKTYDKQAVAKLKAQIESCKALAAKQWLLEKVGALQ